MDLLLKINDFEGPLDLLLHLVKESKMDIYEIEISVIIDEYLDYIHQMEKLNIDIASSYLVMASELVHLKSKMLLNVNDEEEETEYSINSEEDLKNKLIEYERYKKVSSDFKTYEEKRKEVYTKTPENINEFLDEREVPKGVLQVDELMAAFLKFLEHEELNKPVNTKVTKREYSVEERCVSIREKLKKTKVLQFTELFDIMNKDYLVVTFLSVLQMCKNNEILINQDKNFSNITIEKR